MHSIVECATADQLERFCALPGYTPEQVTAHRADAHWMAVDAAADTVACCSLWWTHVPSHDGRRVGFIGHFAAASRSAAVALLGHGCKELAAAGCGVAIGPVDGSTWRRYRLVTERGREPAFFLEPDNPDEWVCDFRHAGFTTLASYTSALCTDLTRRDPRLPRVAVRAQGLGIAIRALDVARFDDELRRLYAMTRAFGRNFLFSPLTEAEFIAHYRPMLPYLRPELVLLAEQAEVPVGFAFCVPDMLETRRGAPRRTAVLKSLAVVDEVAGIGLGSLLVARVNQAAEALGYTRVIYALMHEQNVSTNIGRRYGTTMRRYELFARNLGTEP